MNTLSDSKDLEFIYWIMGSIEYIGLAANDPYLGWLTKKKAAFNYTDQFENDLAIKNCCDFETL